MNLDTGILTNLLTTFVSAFSGGFSKVYPDAMGLLAILSLLEISVAAVWWSIAEDNAIVSFLKKCIQIGFFVFVVSRYQWLIGVLLDGFVTTGMKAGGGGSLALIKNPSAIVDFGFTATDPIFQHIKDYGPVDTMANLPDIIMTGISGILVLLSYFAIGIQIFITYLEFYIIAVLGLILVPFGVFKHTSFIAEKVFGAIVSFGIRLMVLAFILTVAAPTLASLVLPPEPDWNQIFTMLLAALTIMGLSWHAPGVASGLISGAPSLTAGAALGMGAAAGAGLAGAGLAVSAGGRGAARLGVSATRAAAATAGAVTTAAQIGSSQTDGGMMTQAAGAVKGVSGLVTHSGKCAFQEAVGGINDSYHGGQSFAVGAFEQVDKSRTGAPPITPNGEGPGVAGASTSTSVPAWAQKIQQARNVVPQEARPGAGMHVPIKHNE